LSNHAENKEGKTIKLCAASAGCVLQQLNRLTSDANDNAKWSCARENVHAWPTDSSMKSLMTTA